MEICHPEGREDIADLVRIHGLAWRAAYEDLLPEQILAEIPVDPSEEAVTNWTERVRADRERFLVAQIDGAVRGYAYFQWGSETKSFVGEHEAGLKEIYVHPEDWGEGIGTALLERGLDLLPERIEALKLEMLAGNEVGKGFYEARGFDEVGTSQFAVGSESYPTVVYANSL
jgi:ribosomal protein S18 acetylase RimI-like enzyme